MKRKAYYFDILESIYILTADKLAFFYFLSNMAIINLSFNTNETNRLMTLCENDIRFITAKSLTLTAQEVQKKVKSHLHTAFTLRRPNFERSIKIRPATKQNLQAEVYTMAGFAALQQTGGKQTALNGRLAIPQYESLKEVKAGRKTNVAGSFLMKLKSGGYVIAGRPKNEFKILYYLKPAAYNPKRLNMLEIGEEVSMREFPALFRDNLRIIPQ